MIMFTVFLSIGGTLLVIAALMYWGVPWLMSRDCEFEVKPSDIDKDLTNKPERNQKYVFNNETGDVERIL